MRGIVFCLDLVVVILISDKANRQYGRKMYVLLGCEIGGKYRKYKSNLQPSIIRKRKCDCPFRLWGKSVGMGEGWQLKVKCGTHNHDLSKTLAGHLLFWKIGGTLAFCTCWYDQVSSEAWKTYCLPWRKTMKTMWLQ